jgi:hypothetical protein
MREYVNIRLCTFIHASSFGRQTWKSTHKNDIFLYVYMRVSAGTHYVVNSCTFLYLRPVSTVWQYNGWEHAEKCFSISTDPSMIVQKHMNNMHVFFA